nr:MAG TPA: hypothetical protein [Caudoviricetes sp.]
MCPVFKSCRSSIKWIFNKFFHFFNFFEIYACILPELMI